MYLADVSDAEESQVPRGLCTDLNFSENIECANATSNMKLNLNTYVKDVECKVLNGRKVSIKVMLEVIYEAYENIETNIIQNINDEFNMQCLKKNSIIDTLIGSGNEQVTLKENLILEDDNAQEILGGNVSLINKDIKLSYNKILAKADANVNVMYLNKENQVKVYNSSFPLTCFIDMDRFR